MVSNREIGKEFKVRPVGETRSLMMDPIYGKLPLSPHSISSPLIYTRDGHKFAPSSLSLSLSSCCCSSVSAEHLHKRGLERKKRTRTQHKEFISHQIRSASIARFVRNPLVPFPYGIKSSSLSPRALRFDFLTLVPHHQPSLPLLSLLRRLYGFHPPRFLPAASAPADPERIQAAFAQRSEFFISLSCLWWPLFCSGSSRSFGEYVCFL